MSTALGPSQTDLNYPDQASVHYLNWQIALLTAVTIWWLARRYIGFGHDALYYAADVLRRIGDESINSDLFFGRGTQGDFSIYPWVYAALARALGISNAALALTLTGRLAWLVALATLCRALLHPRQAAIGFVLALLLPAYYDSHKLLSYGEPFETPRHWAECVVMLSLSAATRRRHALSLMLAVIACAIHPLMGLPGLAVAVLMLPGKARNWMLIGCLSTFAALASLQLGPLQQLIQTYDDAWFAIVRNRNPMVLVTEWDLDAVCRAAMWTFFLWAGGALSPSGTAPRRLGLGLACATTAFLSVWIIGCLTHNVLVIQMQPYRALWIAQLGAPLVLLNLLPTGIRWRGGDRVFLALLLSAILSELWTCLPLAILAVGYRAWLPRGGHSLSPSSRHWVDHAAFCILAIIIVSRVARIGFIGVAFEVILNDPRAQMSALLTEPIFTGSVVAVLIYADRRLGWIQSQVGRLVAGAVPILALTYWLQSAESLIRLERPSWAAALKQELPKGTTVFWDSGAQAIWTLIGKASYASVEQGAGSLFARPPALELDRRLRRLETLHFIPDRLETQVSKAVAAPRLAANSDVRALCNDPVLDMVLLSGSRSDATKVFRASPRATSTAISIFECDHFRARNSSAQ